MVRQGRTQDAGEQPKVDFVDRRAVGFSVSKEDWVSGTSDVPISRVSVVEVERAPRVDSAEPREPEIKPGDRHRR